VYITGVLLEAWDCITTPDGGSMLRSDPTTSCTSASHLRFRRLAMVCVCVVAPGVPLAYTLWLRRLRATALAEPSTFRPVWRGLADPSTRASWGSLFQMYRFSAFSGHADDEAASRGARARRALSRAVSPFFESFIFLEKACLVIAARLLSSSTAQAAVQAAIYALWAALVALAWPFQRLDVHIPLLVWAPLLPRRFWPAHAPDVPAPGALALLPVGWRRAPARLGWLWVSHLRIGDALNWTAVSANLVPLVNIVAALAAGGHAASVLDLFLIGLNVLKILLTLAAWLACVANWRTQTQELALLRAARRRARRRAARRRGRRCRHAAAGR
jgi:hypothetical protein